MKTQKSMTGINTKITVLADIIQKARITLISDNPYGKLSLDITRRIILICILFLYKQGTFTKYRTATLSDVLMELNLSDNDIFGLQEETTLKHIEISDALNDILSICQYAGWRDLIKYSLESLEYDSYEYFNVKLSRGIRSTNKKKKNQGIYYTPTDVIDFMVSQCISHVVPDNKNPSILDCSCGSGVFLLQSLNYLEDMCNPKHNFDTSICLLKKCIWGIDISQSAIDCCKIVFLQYYIENYDEFDYRLGEVWDIINDSFFVGDATNLQSIISLHTGMPAEFDCIVGNPPYVSYGKDSNLFIPFVENMMIYSSEKSYSALILPLSICYSQGKDYVKLRNKIEDDRVTWIFMNYDRSPDSLFGDQVKTRNTILFRSNHKNKPAVFTTTLQRWTSTKRDSLFTDYMLCDISGMSLSKNVPKLSCEIEKQSLNLLKYGDSNLKELFSPCYSDYPLVISGTAYNWICAYDHLPPSTDKEGNDYISGTIKVYHLPDRESRDFCIALLSNRITYWYWVVIGDGFHLNASFLTEYHINKNDFTTSQYKELCQLGALYSQLIQEHPTISYNAGKRIVNYCHWEAMDIIKRIEKIIVTAMNLPDDFVSYIEQWYYNHVYCNRNYEER